MSNQEILEKFVPKIGTEKAIDFCENLSMFFDLKYKSTNDLILKGEYDYERDWWKEKSESLKQQRACLQKTS